MNTLFFGLALLVVGFVALRAAVTVRERGGTAAGAAGLVRTIGMLVAGIGALAVLGSFVVVIDAGTVGVKHAFGYVSPTPLMPGFRIKEPWAAVEEFSTREEQFPQGERAAEEIAAQSSEQMGMMVDVALRWQIDPLQAPRIYTELGTESRIHAVVQNAIRSGVRDGMVQFSINDLAKRNLIAATMEREVDSALITRPRAGTGPFRVASVTAFFLRDLQPPQQVVQAINAKIAQEQQIQTERHRVDVARLQADQQRLLNQTLTPEALTKQYLEVLEQMKSSNNLVVLVPTEGGIPLLDIGALRRNVRP